MATSSATIAFRAEQVELANIGEADLRAIWRSLDPGDALATKATLLDVVPDLVRAYGEIGAAAAADYYEELRASAPGVRTSFTAMLPDEIAPLAAAQASTRWAIGPLWTEADDLAYAAEVAVSNLAGAVRRQILTPARETVWQNVARDRDSFGFRRIGNGDSCAFCRMLLGRGAVYSKDTVHFAAHDRCDCTAEPAFEGGPAPTPMQYMASKRRRNRTAAERAQLRDYLRQYED